MCDNEFEQLKIEKIDGKWTCATGGWEVVAIDEAIDFLKRLKAEDNAKYISFPEYTSIVEQNLKVGNKYAKLD